MKAKTSIEAVIDGREYHIKKGETIPSEIVEHIKTSEKESKND